MAETFRVVVPGDTMDRELWDLAFAYAARAAADSSPPATEVVLLTHTKSQLAHTSLADRLGDGVVRALNKGSKIGLSDGVTMRHETLRTVGRSAGNAVVIACYAEDKMLETVDGLAGVRGVVAVPDFDGQADLWIRRWNPVVHGEKREADQKLIEDPIVEKALESITLRTNIAYEMIQPRDKVYANEAFRILRAKGHSLNPAMIKSWAIRRGWKPGGADDLSEIAAKVAKLKGKPSMSAIHDAAGRYDRWTR